MRNWKLTTGSALMCIFLIGCAAQKNPVSVTASERQKGILIEARNFEFNPNIITVNGPGTVSLDIKNVANMGHNLTVKNPEGVIIKSVDLPQGKTVTVEIALPRPGTYPIYCDKPLHTSFGMKGEIKVEH